MSFSNRPIFLAAILAITLVGCADAPTSSETPPPPPPPQLQPGVWALAQADGQPLPAYIGHRTTEGALEQVWLDSATLSVNSGARYEQRVFMTVRRDGAVSHRSLSVDAGSWRRVGDQYELLSSGSGRVITLRTSLLLPELRATERLVPWPGGGLVASRYVPKPPSIDPVAPPPPVTLLHYRATAIGESTLPALAERVLDEPNVGGAMDLMLDSASVRLLSDGKYEWRSYQSMWETNNLSLLGFRRVGRRQDGDRGTWTRSGTRVVLTSTLYAGRTSVGEVTFAGLRLTQGMAPGEPPLDVRYTQVPTGQQ